MKEWITGDRVSDGFWDIEIKNANTLGDVFYTVDGSTPTEESFRYTSPFKFYNSSVVKAICIHEKSKSNVATAKYELNVGKTQSQ